MLSIKYISEKIIPTLFGAWFIATILSQHPEPGLDRVRRLDDRWGNVVVPNWRFFAPTPAVEDVHILYRFANKDKTEHSLWQECHTISNRRWYQSFWFPRRRFEKAVFDAHQTIIMALSSLNGSAPIDPYGVMAETVSATEQLLNNYVCRESSPDDKWQWQQLMLVRFADNDPDASPIYDLVFDYKYIRDGSLV